MPLDGTIFDEPPQAAPMEPGTVRAIILYNVLDPLDRQLVDMDWHPGKTVAEYMGAMPEGVAWTVSVGGRFLQPDELADATLLDCDTLIVSVTPMKGNVGMVIVLVLAVVLAVVAPYLVAALAPELVTMLGVSVITSEIIAGVVVGVGSAAVLSGAMAMTATTAKPKDRASNEPGADSPSYGLSGAQNTAREEAPVPALYGKFRVGGNRSNLYIENSPDGLTQDVYLQYAVSDGPVYSINNLLINDQPASNFVGVEFDARTGEIGQPPLSWFTNTIAPHNDGRLITAAALLYTTTTAVDRVRLDVAFPGGLFSVDSKTGDKHPASVGFTAWAVPVGGGDAFYMGGSQWVGTGAPNGLTDLASKSIRLVVRANGAAGLDAQTPFDTHVVLQRIFEGNPTPQIILDQSESGLVTNQYLDGNSWAAGERLFVYEASCVDAINWSIVVTGGDVISCEVLNDGDAVITRNERNPVRMSIHSPTLPRGFYNIYINRTSVESAVQTLQDRCNLESINEINTDPTAYNRTAYYAVKIRLTDQLSSIPSTTVEVMGRKVWRYDSNGGRIEKVWSDNPSDIVLDILLSDDWNQNGSNLRIDFPSFLSWRARCDALGLKFNGTFDTITNRWDAVLAVMRIGRASPVLSGLRWSVVMEAADEPVMMFGSQNMVKGSFNSFWLGREGRANHVEVQYFDEADVYRQQSVFAIDDPSLGRGETLRQATIRLFGVTNAVQAQAEANLQLRLNQNIVQGCNFTAFTDAIGCTIGDVIYVQNDLTKWGWADRVQSTAGSVVRIRNPLSAAGATVSHLPGPVAGMEDEAHTGQIQTYDQDLLTTEGLSAPAQGQLMPDGAWKILVLKPTALLLTQAVATRSGSQITFNPPISDLVKADRIVIDGLDYDILDRVLAGGQTVFTLDRPPGSVAGHVASFYKVDVMAEGDIARPHYEDTELVVTNWPHSFGIEAGDQVMIGRVGYFKKPFRVNKFTYDSEHTRTISCMEYVEGVYTEGFIPDDANYSEIATRPLHVLNVSADQSSEQVVGGGIRYIATVAWNLPLNDTRGHAGSNVFLSVDSGPFTFHERVVDGRQSSSIYAVEGQVVRFKVVAFDQLNFNASFVSAPMAAVTIGRRTRAPTAPSGLTLSSGIRLIGLRWTKPDDADIKFYEVFESETASIAGAYLVGETSSNVFTRSGLLPLATRWYWVRSVSYAGEVSGYTAPVSGTTSILVTDDIANGIINTAKLAGAIGMAEVVVGGTLPTTGNFPDRLVHLTGNGQIYQFRSGAWVHVPDLDTIGTGARVVAKLAAGLVTAAEIRAGAIRANHLAADTIISQAIQVGSAVIHTAAIQNAAIDSAKIRDLEVDTIKIRGSALTTVTSSTNLNSNSCGDWNGESVHFENNILAVAVELQGDGRCLIATSFNHFYRQLPDYAPDPGGGGNGDGGGG